MSRGARAVAGTPDRTGTLAVHGSTGKRYDLELVQRFYAVESNALKKSRAIAGIGRRSACVGAAMPPMRRLRSAVRRDQMLRRGSRASGVSAVEAIRVEGLLRRAGQSPRAPQQNFRARPVRVAAPLTSSTSERSRASVSFCEAMPRARETTGDLLSCPAWPRAVRQWPRSHQRSRTAAISRLVGVAGMVAQPALMTKSRCS